MAKKQSVISVPGLPIMGGQMDDSIFDLSIPDLTAVVTADSGESPIGVNEPIIKERKSSKKKTEIAVADPFVAGVYGDTGVLAQRMGKNWAMLRGDSCQVAKGLPSNSIDLCIHSPPFSSLYVYSDSESDMGNCSSDQQFAEHYSYLARELYRVMVPGRLVVIHCKDLPAYISRDEFSGLRDFPALCREVFQAAGFEYHSKVTIWKCPVIERGRTNSYGLLHNQLCRDSAASRQGMPDYLVVMRKWDGLKPEDFPKPVNNPSGLVLMDEATGEPLRDAETGEIIPREQNERYRFESYLGSLPPGSNWRFDWREFDDEQGKAQRAEICVDHRNEVIWEKRDFSIQVWQRYASPVWFDIDQTDVLNYKGARSERDERHICPLQMGVIRRCVHLWSNPGDVVMTPFAGIGSECVGALELGRKGLGIELKDTYFDSACRKLAAKEGQAKQLSLY